MESTATALTEVAPSGSGLVRVAVQIPPLPVAVSTCCWPVLSVTVTVTDAVDPPELTVNVGDDVVRSWLAVGEVMTGWGGGFPSMVNVTTELVALLFSESVAVALTLTLPAASADPGVAVHVPLP
jgi:hypothetical protein